MQPGGWGVKLPEIRLHKEKTKRILKLKKEVWTAWTFVGMFFTPFPILNSSWVLFCCRWLSDNSLAITGLSSPSSSMRPVDSR